MLQIVTEGTFDVFVVNQVENLTCYCFKFIFTDRRWQEGSGCVVFVHKQTKIYHEVSVTVTAQLQSTTESCFLIKKLREYNLLHVLLSLHADIYENTESSQ